MSPEDFLWTDEAEYYLRKKWAESWSAGAIAVWFTQTYSRIFTRNAIMGKVHRLELPKRVGRDREPDAKRIPKKPKKARKPWHRLRPEPIQPPSGREVSFRDISAGMCRYIPGEPDGLDTMFCGDLAFGPYCAYHTQRTSNPRGR